MAYTNTAASPAVSGDRVYVPNFSCQVLAIDWRRGKTIWTYEHATRKFPYYASCAVDESRVIACGRDKLVHALHPADGTVAWTFRTRARIDGSPVVVSDRVFVASGDGTIYMLSLDRGKKLWSFTAGAPFAASPAIASGRLVIGDDDGKVYCFAISEPESPKTKPKPQEGPEKR